MRIHPRGVRLALLLLVLAAAAAGVPSYSWVDGESRTIVYTQGVTLFAVLDTNVPLTGSSGSVVSGAAPAGLNLFFNCLGPGNSRCAYFSGTPTESAVRTIVLRMSDSGGDSTDIEVTLQPAFTLSAILFT